MFLAHDTKTVVGIMSYNTPTCPAGQGQYRSMLVSGFVDWINATITPIGAEKVTEDNVYEDSPSPDTKTEAPASESEQNSYST